MKKYKVTWGFWGDIELVNSRIVTAYSANDAKNRVSSTLNNSMICIGTAIELKSTVYQYGKNEVPIYN